MFFSFILHDYFMLKVKLKFEYLMEFKVDKLIKYTFH